MLAATVSCIPGWSSPSNARKSSSMVSLTARHRCFNSSMVGFMVSGPVDRVVGCGWVVVGLMVKIRGRRRSNKVALNR